MLSLRQNAARYLHHSLLLAATTLLPRPVFAQTGPSIIPSSEPQCVQQCPIFIQAFAACANDAGVQAQYTACFCQSAYLQQIKGSNTNVCTPYCSDADFGSFAVWYDGFCANGGVQPTPAAGGGTTMVTVTTTPAPAGATTSSTSSATPSATAVNQGSGSTPDSANAWQDGPGWLRTHWQWVVMIVVLFVAFLVIGIGGTIWYRRYKKRREYGANSTAPRSGPHVAASHPEISQWAPSQHSVHDFGAGPGPFRTRHATNESGSPLSRTDPMTEVVVDNGKGKGKQVVREHAVPERVQSPVSSVGPARAPSRRLTKTPVGSAR